MTDLLKEKRHQAFLDSTKKHILVITNHGIHQWNVIPGLPDTGGQDVYVNQLTDVLAKFGFKITIANRGGYNHPTTGEKHTGLRYKDENQRILYIEDEKKDFVRKEDMKEQIPQLVDFLKNFLDKESLAIDLIISNYWDAAYLGVLLNEKLANKVQHIWIPHSLGAVKKNNMPPETWEKLRVDERIETEKEFIGKLDFVAATSSLIRNSLINDYNQTDPLFLPPCVKPDRYHKKEIPPGHEIWTFLKKTSGISKNKLHNSKIITEISRTDKTKRKDILIKAFDKVHKKHKDALLLVSIDKNEKELYTELTYLIKELNLETDVIVIGHEPQRLPFLYNVTYLYCSPSIMEGFGMSVQEAAATQVPVVGSTLIPFVKEYLLGDDVKKIDYNKDKAPIQFGKGGIIVEPDDINGFAYAIEMLLANEELRNNMGKEAFRITVPYFTWEDMTKRLLKKANIEILD